MPGRFDPATTAKAVHATLDDAMAALPAHKRGAVLIDATTDGVRAVYVQRVNDNWRIALEGEYDGSHVAGKVATEIVW